MAKKSGCRFTLPHADAMRAEVGASLNRLAGSAGCSRHTAQLVLDGIPRTKNVCEKVVNGLQRLGHPKASHKMIVESVDFDAE